MAYILSMEGKRRALLKTQSNVITNRAFVFVCIIYHPKRRTAAPPRVFPTRHVALVKFLYICCIFVKKWLKSRCIRLLRRYLPLKNPYICSKFALICIFFANKCWQMKTYPYNTHYLDNKLRINVRNDSDITYNISEK